MIYLIDTENVAGGWVAFAQEKHRRDPSARFLVMYTDGTPRLTYDEAAAITADLSGCTVFARCSKGRPNALDFRLVAQVGILAMESPEEHFCIVSNDQGFDEAIQAYQTGGIHVVRQACSNRLTVDPPAPLGRLGKNVSVPESVSMPDPQPDEIPTGEQEVVSTVPAEDDEASQETDASEESGRAEDSDSRVSEMEQENEDREEERKRLLHQKQRRFLSAYCSVPKMIAEAVRSALEKDLTRAEKTIRNSKARAFGTDSTNKENAIRCLREHYDEYCRISADPVSGGDGTVF